MPVHSSHDDRGKYYQYGDSGEKYHVADYGEDGARKKAYAQESAIEHSGYTEKANRLQTGFHPLYGKYYRWGSVGIPYYVRIYGDRSARQRAYNDGALERLRGGYTQ